MEVATRKLVTILEHADKTGIDSAAFYKLRSVRLLIQSGSNIKSSASLHFLAGFISVSLALVYVLGLNTAAGFTRTWFKWNQIDIHGELCTIPMPEVLMKAFRPPEDCSICKGITGVDRVQKITPEEFEAIYAYTGIPVVVQDAMTNWTAQHVFSYNFFKDIYEHSGERQEACQFFPYKTKFTGLREVFNMSGERAAMLADTDPWYIGWSNCDKEAALTLRQHYSRPYFLPDTSENKKVDWIFMGSPGYGAKMHIDSVGYPSWQAQLKGRKLWILEPPPECLYQCNSLQVTVQPGEIIVLDTNRWYHETLIVSRDMSITIGAEYD